MNLRLESENRGLRQMLEVSRKLSGQFDLAELLSQIIDNACQVLEADRASVFLYDAKARQLYTIVAHGVTGITFSIEAGIAGQCARDRRTIHVPDCYADPRFNPEIDRQTGYRTNCMVAVPLIGLERELVGVLQVLNPRSGRFDAAAVALAELLADQAAAAIQRVRLLDDRLQKIQFEQELTLARQIQRGVLPASLPLVRGYSLATWAESPLHASGDIYDLVTLESLGETPGTNTASPLFMLLADATGHGVGPALSVVQVRAMARAALRLGAPLPHLFQCINQQLQSDVIPGRFVTAFLGLLDPATHELKYISAGQAPLLHFHAASQTMRDFDANTFPLGLADDPTLEEPPPIALEPGDLFVLLSDGFFEAANDSGKLLGKEGVTQVITDHHDKSPEVILQRLLQRVKEFAEHQPLGDDITAVILKREG